MKAAVFNEFKQPLIIKTVPDPSVPDDGVVIAVKATGICRSDWHGWQGHDPDIQLPHVPGHEIAGEIVETGKNIKNWKPGDRVTLPFVCGCGRCEPCSGGNPQVCDDQFQPGFTHWGSFAEYVAVHYAENNLVKIPDELNYVETASLGCRFITSFRAVLDRGRIKKGQWLSIYGCGGVGLAAVMIGKAVGARVIAVDISEENLSLARSLGAEAIINVHSTPDVVSVIKELSSGGVDVSIDALGSTETSINSILSLRKLGRHVQVGLLAGEHERPPIPMEAVIANELEISGSHGMAASQYGRLFDMIKDGRLDPGKLVTRTVDLEEGIEVLQDMDSFQNRGIVVIDKY